MCTLSFIPEEDGYILAMNRDELKNRAIAATPSVHRMGAVSLIYPQEPSGGTWIGANSRGNLFALMNTNGLNSDGITAASGATPRVTAEGAPRRSRGEIIPLILQEIDMDDTVRAVEKLSFMGMAAFRLFAFFPLDRKIRQWAWDGQRQSVRAHDWIRNHWFSSSRSDARAEAQRGQAFEASWRENRSDPTAWLRSIHASHIPDAGAFSICVHREDAATVSYTEVQYNETGSDRPEVRMSYRAGNPCESAGAPTSMML